MTCITSTVDRQRRPLPPQRRAGPPQRRARPRQRREIRPAWLALAAVAALAVPLSAHAQHAPQRRPGKVLIIRGAFTVFSLGLDTLGEQLQQHGLSVQVVPAYSASSATAELAEEYRRRPEPIVVIGHSKGGYLAPECAAQLAKSRIPVRLVVIVDNPHSATVPGNVRRCVNFYQSNMLGVVQGALARAETSKTELFNVNIDQLPGRDEGGYIDHFNIDASPWVHSMIVKQVLIACAAEAGESARRDWSGGGHRLARPSGPTLRTRPAQPTRLAQPAEPVPRVSGIKRSTPADGGSAAPSPRGSQSIHTNRLFPNDIRVQR